MKNYIPPIKLDLIPYQFPHPDSSLVKLFNEQNPPIASQEIKGWCSIDIYSNKSPTSLADTQADRN